MERTNARGRKQGCFIETHVEKKRKKKFEYGCTVYKPLFLHSGPRWSCMYTITVLHVRYTYTIAATTFLKYVHRLCLRLESLMIFSGRAKWAAQSFERKTGREFRRTRWIEKERKRERKREDRKISSRMVGRAAIERANSREREGKRKEEEGEFRSAVRIGRG